MSSEDLTGEGGEREGEVELVNWVYVGGVGGVGTLHTFPFPFAFTFAFTGFCFCFFDGREQYEGLKREEGTRI